MRGEKACEGEEELFVCKVGEEVDVIMTDLAYQSLGARGAEGRGSWEDRSWRRGSEVRYSVVDTNERMVRPTSAHVVADVKDETVRRRSK